MTIQLSRRLILTGAAGATLAGTARAAAVKKEEAFPPEVLAHEHALLGPDEGVALLARNENPYGPSESALRMVEYAGKKGAYYPGQANITLAEMIAERHGVDPKQIVITTGSGEALSAIAVLYGPKGPIVAPRLFWDTTALYATRLGMAEITRVPLKEDMSVDLAGIEAAVTEDTGLVQLCKTQISRRSRLQRRRTGFPEQRFPGRQNRARSWLRWIQRTPCGWCPARRSPGWSRP